MPQIRLMLMSCPAILVMEELLWIAPKPVSSRPMSENMRPIGQRISSPIKSFSFRGVNGLPENKVQDDAADKQDHAEHSRTLQKMLLRVLDFWCQRIHQTFQF